MDAAAQTPTTTVIIMRHGDVHNPNRVYYGRLPRFRLSATGRDEAGKAAAYLRDRPIAAVYSSPMLRARQTADIVAAGVWSQPVRHVTQWLNEAHSPFDGESRAVMRARNWDLYEGVSAEYEQPADLLARVHLFLARTLRRHPGEQIVAVTHGDIVAFTLLWALGYGLDKRLRGQLRQCGLSADYPATASLSTLTFRGVNLARPATVAYHEAK